MFYQSLYILLILDFNDNINQATQHFPWFGFQEFNGQNKDVITRTDYSPKFAQSVWLEYTEDGYDRAKFQKIKRNGWILKNTIVVQKTVPATYFSVIIYGGGYAGIQQLDNRFCGQSKGINN